MFTCNCTAAAQETGYANISGTLAEYQHLLYCSMMNILNGGSHADNKIDIQEFMVMRLAQILLVTDYKWELKFSIR